jgi:hypothetical protein
VKNDTEAPGDELDLIKVYIWVMVAMTVVLAGVVWFTSSQVDETRKDIEFARKNLQTFAETKQEIGAMLNVYTANKEDEARLQPLTWFSRVWQRKGINDQSIRPQAWQEKYNARGNFDENFIELKFDNKNPLTRKQIGELCHEIERASTRLRLIELKLRRAGRKDSFEDDSWSGSVVVGYRKARIRGE